MKILHLIYFTICFSLLMQISLHAEEGLWQDDRVKTLPTDQLGPFVHTKNGDILAIDDAASYISKDGGKSWSLPRPLFTGQQNIKVSNERALFRTREGVVIAAFMNLNERKWTWSNKLGDAPDAQLPTYVMRSLDDGKTWQDIQKLHVEWSGAVRDMIQTKEGRVIFTAMKMQHHPGRHAVLTYSSTNNGKTWKASNLIDLGGAGHHGGVTEPTLTELKDGRIWMLIRTNWGVFWSAYSSDGGQFWRVIKPSDIPASSAPGLIKRLHSGRLLLVWNRPYPEGKKSWKLSGGDKLWSATAVSNHREELSIAFSDNDGKNWSHPIVIAHKRNSKESGSRKWLSYPYVFETTPGHLWITTMQGGLRVKLRESDFVKHQTSSTKATTKVIAFGDSTTAKRGSIESLCRYSSTGITKRNDLPVQIINAGVGGHNTNHARQRFVKDVLENKPDIVIIQFGINDAAVDVWKKPPATTPRVALKAYVSNLRHFVKQLKKQKRTVILMTPNPLRWTPKMRKLYGKPPYKQADKNGFNIFLADYAKQVRQLAKAENVPIIDVYQNFEQFGMTKKQSVNDLLLDGVHPNATGHRRVADLLIQLLLKQKFRSTQDEDTTQEVTGQRQVCERNKRKYGWLGSFTAGGKPPDRAM